MTVSAETIEVIEKTIEKCGELTLAKIGKDLVVAAGMGILKGAVGAIAEAMIMKLLQIKTAEEKLSEQLALMDRKIDALASYIKGKELAHHLESFRKACNRIQVQAGIIKGYLESSTTSQSLIDQNLEQCFQTARTQLNAPSWKHFMVKLLEAYTNYADVDKFLLNLTSTCLKAYSDALIDRDDVSVHDYVVTLMGIHAHFYAHAVLASSTVAMAVLYIRKHAPDRLTAADAERLKQDAQDDVARVMATTTPYVHSLHPEAFDIYRQLWDKTSWAAFGALPRCFILHIRDKNQDVPVLQLRYGRETWGERTLGNSDPRQSVVVQARHEHEPRSMWHIYHDAWSTPQSPDWVRIGCLSEKSQEKGCLVPIPMDTSTFRFGVGDFRKGEPHIGAPTEQKRGSDPQKWQILPGPSPFFRFKNHNGRFMEADPNADFVDTGHHLVHLGNGPRKHTDPDRKHQFWRIIRANAPSPHFDRPRHDPGSFDEVGYYGSDGGACFDDLLSFDAQPASIQTIRIFTGVVGGNFQNVKAVRRIIITYRAKDGSLITRDHGANGTEEPALELGEGEFITEIEGQANVLLDRISFKTNKGRVHGPFGGTGGNTFKAQLPGNGRLVALFGRSGQAIDAIGCWSVRTDM